MEIVLLLPLNLQYRTEVERADTIVLFPILEGKNSIFHTMHDVS